MKARSLRGYVNARFTSLRTRLFLAMSLLGTGVLIIALLISTIVQYRMWYGQTTDTFRQASYQINGMVALRMDELTQALISLMLDDSVKKLFLNEYVDEYESYTVRKSVDKLLTSIHSHYLPIRISIAIDRANAVYTNAGSFANANMPYKNSATERTYYFVPSFYHMRPMPDTLKDTAWYKRLENDSALLHFIDDYELPGLIEGQPLFTQLYRYPHTNNIIGYIAFSVTSEWINPLFQDYVSDAIGGIVVRGATGNTLFESGDVPALLKTESPDSFDQEISSIRDDKEEYILYHAYTGDTGLHMFFCTNNRVLHHAFYQLLLLFGVLIIAMIAVILLISMRIARETTAPLTEMAHIVATTEAHKLDLPAYTYASTEIQLLADCLSGMSARIDTLISDLLGAQLSFKEAEINALKQQINPHFLYNVLETISSIAVINDCPEICEICVRLGGMMRFSLSRGSDLISLQQELDHVDNYIAIQKVRNDHFDCVIDIDPAYLETFILRASLQPIVENCFRHAFKGLKRRGHIDIRCSSPREGVLCLIVRDNGWGLSAKNLAALQALLQSGSGAKSGDHIGLSNVHMRFRSTYGPDYGLSVDSLEGEGTSVSLWLPLPTV